MEYYGAFFPSELIFLVHHLDKLLYRWVVRKYKKQGGNFKKAESWVKRLKSKSPDFFVHWGLLHA
jgi:RNA-directed DNA polymerase